MPKRSAGDPASCTQAPGSKITVTLVADMRPLQYIDGVRDPIRLLHQGLHSVARVAQCDDAAMALKAGTWLVEYATVQLRHRDEERAKRVPVALAAPEGREQILAELKGLYAKALGPSQLVVEAEPEPETKS